MDSICSTRESLPLHPNALRTRVIFVLQQSARPPVSITPTAQLPIRVFAQLATMAAIVRVVSESAVGFFPHQHGPFSLQPSVLWVA